MDKEQIYKDILWRKGEHRQIEKAIEEVNELAVELAHWNKREVKLDGQREKLVDELADTMIMWEQVVRMVNCQEEVNERMEYKLQRMLINL